jgi:diguanylate cyclase (GGDEF)-like protein
MQFVHIRNSLSLVRPLAVTGIIIAGAIVVGYAGGIEWLYRPLTGGPAAHPLTAASLILLGAGILLWRPCPRGVVPTLLATVALAHGTLRLAEIGLHRNLLSAVTPFYAITQADAADGMAIATGINSATMILLLAVALITTMQKKYGAAQLFAFLGLGIPLVAITGYAYGIDNFLGRMAPSTALAALPVGAAILFSSANHGAMRSILSPWAGGRVARLQIMLGYIVPFVLGYALMVVTTDRPAELFGVSVVAVSAFVTGLVAYSATIHDQVDKMRRCAERQLGLAATRDVLTNLPNRRLLLDEGLREIDRAARNRSPLSMLMVDIDNLKQVNDRFGHATGDQVLKRVAEVIRHELRHQDLPARYGGEEFAVLLPDTPVEGATQLGEKLRRRIADEFFNTFERDAFAVTVSVGCAQHSEGKKFNQLLCTADEALVRAKTGGRNRVESGD